MPSDTQQRVNELPCGIPSDGLTAVKRLFWTDLTCAVECLAAVRYPKERDRAHTRPCYRIWRPFHL